MSRPLYCGRPDRGGGPTSGAIVGTDLVNGPLSRRERREQTCMAETVPQATPEMTRAAARPSVRAALAAATIICVGTLLLATFELSLADWPSGFVLLGILPLTALLFFGCCVWTATLLLRIRKGGIKFAIPFLICAVTLALLQYAPLDEVALQQNFQWHRADRERIVARVEKGELKPKVDYNGNLIALGEREPN